MEGLTIELDHVETFVTVAQLRNFTRAATQLHVSQSTITLRIKALEAEVGRALFERDSRSVRLTSAGETFLPYARSIVDLVEESSMRLRIFDEHSERIVIGTLDSIWHHLMLPVVQELQSAFQQMSIRLITGHSSDIIRQLSDGLLDVGVILVPPRDASFEVECIGEFPIILVASPDVACEEPMTCANILTSPLVYVNWGIEFADWYEQHIAKGRIPALRVDTATLFLNYLLGGGFIGFAPNYVVDPLITCGKLRRLTLDADVPNRPIYSITLKRRSKDPLVKRWREHLNRYFS